MPKATQQTTGDSLISVSDSQAIFQLPALTRLKREHSGVMAFDHDICRDQNLPTLPDSPVNRPGGPVQGIVDEVFKTHGANTGTVMPTESDSGEVSSSSAAGCSSGTSSENLSDAQQMINMNARKFHPRKTREEQDEKISGRSSPSTDESSKKSNPIGNLDELIKKDSDNPISQKKHGDEAGLSIKEAKEKLVNFLTEGLKQMPPKYLKSGVFGHNVKTVVQDIIDKECTLTKNEHEDMRATMPNFEDHYNNVTIRKMYGDIQQTRSKKFVYDLLKKRGKQYEKLSKLNEMAKAREVRELLMEALSSIASNETLCQQAITNIIRTETITLVQKTVPRNKKSIERYRNDKVYNTKINNICKLKAIKNLLSQLRKSKESGNLQKYVGELLRKHAQLA